jgi:hypothetical protein
MRLGGWKDLESVKRYRGMMQDDKLEAAVERAWA